MDAFREKVAYGLTTLTAAASSTAGAIVSHGEARWLYVTITAAILTAGFLSLIFKRADESIRLVIGRCGIAVLLGVLGSRFAVVHWGIEFVQGDVVLLAGFAAAVTGGGFLIGYPLLHLLNAKSDKLAKKIFDKWLP